MASNGLPKIVSACLVLFIGLLPQNAYVAAMSCSNKVITLTCPLLGSIGGDYCCLGTDLLTTPYCCSFTDMVENRTGLSLGAIIGIVVGIAVGMILLFVLLCCCCGWCCFRSRSYTRTRTYVN